MKYIILAFFICKTLCIQAQQKLHYTYDNAGNRIKKEIVLNSARVAQASNETAKPIALIDQIGEQTVKIYPNPTAGHLILDIQNHNEKLPSFAYIYNLHGMLLNKIPIIKSNTSVDLSLYPAGSYLLRITMGQKVSTWNVLKL